MSIADKLNDYFKGGAVLGEPESRVINAGIDRIISIFYKEFSPEVKRELANAEKYARKGYARPMETQIRIATSYAKEVGQDISAKVAEIENVGYANAVPVALADARRYAEKGDARPMETRLSLAQRYAKEIGQDISPQVTGIRALVN